MSKYTTEVRYICETEAGLDESKGYNDVNEIISLARTKIFNFSYPIYDESYRSVLETKILKHFYTREIGLETVGLWKLKLDTKMNEIMPYYNQLYKSALLEFNPLWTDDYNTQHNKSTDGTQVNVNETDNATVGQTDNVSRNKYADTPQGSLTDLEDDRYLTNARKTTTEESNINNSTSLAQSNNVYNNIEDYLETVQGRRGKDASELLLKYRKTFLNIDMQIIDDLEELFLHLW